MLYLFLARMDTITGKCITVRLLPITFFTITKKRKKEILKQLKTNSSENNWRSLHLDNKNEI